MEIGNICKMDNEELQKMLPKLGIAIQLTGLAKKQATRRNGVQPWEVTRVIQNCQNELVQQDHDQQGNLLGLMQQAFSQAMTNGQLPQSTAPQAPAVDPIAQALNKMSASFDKLAAEVRGATQ